MGLAFVTGIWKGVEVKSLPGRLPIGPGNHTTAWCMPVLGLPEFMTALMGMSGKDARNPSCRGSASKVTLISLK